METSIENTEGFNPGDLIYGLADSRINYNDKFVNSNSTENISTIDQYPISIPEIATMRKYKSIVPNNKEIYSFIEFIDNHHKEKYRAISYASYSFNEISCEIEYDNPELVLGRKCKMGLWWAKENDKRVHFILDDINMEDVVKKGVLYNRDNKLYKPFTGKELRELYRRKGDEKLLGNVRFWKDKKPVAAPWETDNKLWSSYKPKSWKTMSKADIVINEAVTSFL